MAAAVFVVMLRCWCWCWCCFDLESLSSLCVICGFSAVCDFVISDLFLFFIFVREFLEVRHSAGLTSNNRVKYSF